MNNKYVLSRNIPDPVKRTVRQRCGFGCVICGQAIAQYEHFNPSFAEAKEHDPDGIVLLCGSCHDKVTRGFWSKGKVNLASQKPFCIRQGHALDAFDIGANHPIVRMGSTTWINTTTILEVMGEKILCIDPPETSNSPYRLSGFFLDENENELFRIYQNEWIGSLNNWDIEISGRNLTIRRKPGDIALQLIVAPPNEIFISRINMIYKGVKIIGSNSQFHAIAPDNSTVAFNGLYTAEGCKSGILIEANSVSVGCQCNWGRTG